MGRAAASRAVRLPVVAAAVAFCASAAVAGPLELIADRFFQGPLEVLAPAEGAAVVQEVLRPGDAAGDPVWSVAQWNSRFTLADATPEELPSGAYRYADTSKAVTVGPADAPQADLILAMDAREEYGDDPRDAGEPWPHLLVEQRISPPDAAGPGSPPLTEMGALEFRVEARLLYGERFELPGYTPNLHAAQFQIFFVVQNLDRESPGYGDFLWLGVPIYDDRDPSPGPLILEGDVALGKLIYTIAYSAFADTSVHQGEWVTLEADLLPFALDALDEAWERGFLQDSRDPADYYIGGMNMGWEMPGINNAAVQVRGLSLQAVPVGGETPPDPFGDVNGDGRADALDVQLVINCVLALADDPDADLDGSGRCDAVDVQLVINAVLGMP